ncbi:MAG TPA: GntR family transcriptional regulator [Rhodopila sp.]|uniref:GntR family transcriptional regulator n=1 Tax=Rhodopila sp. TaxID=2480087 RepID=UPI002CE8FDEC|nr:GntR family transcriptional regulator [Rhodopila sp.]HVY14933.1 GntR family transcriptional regulator [Rhodopila sp.]
MSFATKQESVAEIIRERIIIGIYGRGTKLKQADLAEELGVSITPVREALLALEAEGYIRGLPHKGLIVPEIMPTSLTEIFDLRLALERSLTAAALDRMDQAGLAKLLSLQQALEAALEAGDLFKVRTENYRFHFCLYEMAERPQTLHFVRVLWAKYPFTLQDVKQDRPRRMRSEHVLFLDRVQQQDKAGAVDAMVRHIRNGWREITQRTGDSS